MKLIVLDRDGVINEDRGEPITSVDDWVPISGSLDAIARLHQAGWHVAVATNQSGIARGLMELDDLQAPAANPRLACCTASVSVWILI